MVQDRREEAGGVAEAEEGELVRGEALHDVVDGDVGRAADKDAEVAGGELEDEFYKGVGFAGLGSMLVRGSEHRVWGS